jgi:hypothetical protein
LRTVRPAARKVECGSDTLHDLAGAWHARRPRRRRRAARLHHAERKE